MKNKIVKCINNTHEIYNNSFKAEKIKIGHLYKCIEELILTSENYYIPKYSSLEGITIINGMQKYWYNKPCFPKECFILANKQEQLLYKIKTSLIFPIYKIRRVFLSNIFKIDKLIRYKKYKEMEEYFDNRF